MFARLGQRALWSGMLVGMLLAAGTTAFGDRTPEGERARRRASFSLFAGPTAVLTANLLQCGMDNQGNVCTDVFNSPTGAGGFWPAGSVDAYIFNTGLQMAGIIPGDQGGPWANDTVAAYIFDARGNQQHSAPLTSLFDSQNPDDLADWPSEARVTDELLFADVLTQAEGGLGARSASQQDSWTRYWDGDPTRNAERKHPMGIRVTQRSLAWNFPSGNESVIYFVYEFENATADPDFQGPNEVQFFGGDNVLPDGGWTIEEMYASFSTDMDVGADAIDNFSTAILPFDVGISYVGSFNRPEMVFPPDLFFPPFFTTAPGIVGVKYLKSPIDPATGEEVGLTLFSNTQNPSSTGAQFIDPLGDEQLWRYLSGQLDPSQGDPPCNVEPEIASGDPATSERSVCFVFQQAADTRFYQASGPFALAPGETGTIVVAYIVAATVATLPDGSPSGILANQSSANANPPGVPSFHPGFGSARGCDVNEGNCTVVRTAAANAVLPIEKASGWFQYTGPPPASNVESPRNKLDQFDVNVVPGSLLDKALIAQTVFDSKFLLPFAPSSPLFWLVEGDGVVTVMWDRTITETDGDPFFVVASDAASALFNPNYRSNDVEGYRIYRGTDPAALELVVQFDYADTRFRDFTCETVRPDEDFDALIDDDSDVATPPVDAFPDIDAVRTITPAGDTVPVVGFSAGDLCPVAFPGTWIERNLGPSVEPVANVTVPLLFNNGGLDPGQGVARAVDLRPIALSIDTVLVSAGFPPLADTGVPFGFNDEGLLNNFTYFYSVTAFDVNSAASAPATLESVKDAKSVVPRSTSPEVSLAQFEIKITGDDGEPLNPNVPLPQIDPEEGTFNGPFPPTNAVELSFVPLAERLFPQFARNVRIDSVVPVYDPGAQGTPGPATANCPRGGDPFGVCVQLHLTVNVDGVETQEIFTVYNPHWYRFGEPIEDTRNLTILASEVPFSEEALVDFGIPSDGGAQTSGNATAIGAFMEQINNSSAEGPQNRRSGSSGADPNARHGGSRWFDGTAEVFPDPARFMRVGHLENVDTVFAPISHTPLFPGGSAPSNTSIGFEKQCFSRAMAKMGRAADVRFTWSGGQVSEVRDIVHHVPVLFSPKVRASYGFLTQDANGNGLIDWNDFNYLDPIIDIIPTIGGGNCDGAGGGAWTPVGPAVDLVQQPSLVATSTEGMDQSFGTTTFTQTGTGFGLYINGERYIFEMSALPGDAVWTLRTYSGYVRSSSATFDLEDPSGYVYDSDYTCNLSSCTGRQDLEGFTEGGERPMLIPGLNLIFQVQSPTEVTTALDLTKVHTVPDPYLATSALDLSPTNKQLMFVNLPTVATIRIYTLTGILVRILNHDDDTGGGREIWDLRNRNNQFAASGVYFFHISTPSGEEVVGKFTIVSFAGQN
jgi:hypothetical protein